jgi:hypothetical protein
MPEATRYHIETLLREGIQIFDNLDPVAFDSLAEAMAEQKDMATVITVAKVKETPRLVLVNGHQRLRAMLRNGRTYITAEDVKVVRLENEAEALDKAIELNTLQRHLSMEDKGRAARRLQSDYGWSQRKIAKKFGVSQPAVSQWFATIDDDGPDEITGEDGKRYPARKRRQPKVPDQPGIPDWVAVAGQLSTMIPVHWEEVPAVHRAEAREVLEDLADAVAAQLAAPVTVAPFD